ncbi:HAD family hydrolase [Paenibacillus cremeus]|uniref:HAD family hydrolase n=1 Tax=Paenibacillus cremeus TaxID=2163881 RepID=A0A559KDD3_9BACL|nr:HAD family hydrolase [Paenibacillus cremeus]TVY10151.1 HAD family hydrolase [Paenibacillus cremeus]
MIKAMVFDFDGLILDTETPEFESFQEIYRRHGSELTIEIWGVCIGTGPNVFNPYEDLAQRRGAPYDVEAARSLRKSLYEQKMMTADVRPGVRAYLEQARELGLRIGLASSSTYEWVSGYLQRFGLFNAFDVIRTRNDVTNVKPDPELYLQAVAALGVQPHEAVAFEDSPNGALAAHRAGLYCVTVPNSVTAQLTFGEHHMRLGSMEQMNLKDVIEQLQNGETNG